MHARYLTRFFIFSFLIQVTTGGYALAIDCKVANTTLDKAICPSDNLKMMDDEITRLTPSMPLDLRKEWDLKKDQCIQRNDASACIKKVYEDGLDYWEVYHLGEELKKPLTDGVAGGRYDSHNYSRCKGDECNGPGARLSLYSESPSSLLFNLQLNSGGYLAISSELYGRLTKRNGTSKFLYENNKCKIEAEIKKSTVVLKTIRGFKKCEFGEDSHGHDLSPNGTYKKVGGPIPYFRNLEDDRVYFNETSPEQYEKRFDVNSTVDCQKPKTSVEKTVCASDDLKMMDKEMSRICSTLPIDPPKGGEREKQKKWVALRDHCEQEKDASSCLKKAYEDRLLTFHIEAPYSPNIVKDDTVDGLYTFVNHSRCDSKDKSDGCYNADRLWLQAHSESPSSLLLYIIYEQGGGGAKLPIKIYGRFTKIPDTQNFRFMNTNGTCEIIAEISENEIRLGTINNKNLCQADFNGTYEKKGGPLPYFYDHAGHKFYFKSTSPEDYEKQIHY